MGFADVYLLEGGRAAWTVMGLPTEGQIGDARRISQFVQEVPAVPLGATIADVKKIGEIPHTVVVLGCDDVVVGALRPSVLELPSRTRVRDIMIPAPSTIRPDLRVEEVVRRLADDCLDHVLVTTVDGVLLGLVTTEGLHV
jgi:CBS-domain-containing membrane protein